MMAKINFEKWSPIPNSEIDRLCSNKHIPVKVRVNWVILKTIYGYPENREKMKAEIGHRYLEEATGASKSQIIRVCKQLQDEDNGLTITRGNGRGNRSIYQLDLTQLGYELSFDDKGKPHYKGCHKLDTKGCHQLDR